TTGTFVSSGPPAGIEQSHSIGWMAFYCSSMANLALTLAADNPAYDDIATTFIKYFHDIADAMRNVGRMGIKLWDEEDQFFYDVMRLPDGRCVPLKVRSLAGLSLLFASAALDRTYNCNPASLDRAQYVQHGRPVRAALVPVAPWTLPSDGRPDH